MPGAGVSGDAHIIGLYSGFLPRGGGRGGQGAPPENFCPSLKFGPKAIA